MNVWPDPTLGHNDPPSELVQLLVIEQGELDAPGGDSLLTEKPDKSKAVTPVPGPAKSSPTLHSFLPTLAPRLTDTPMWQPGTQLQVQSSSHSNTPGLSPSLQPAQHPRHGHHQPGLLGL